MGVTFAFLSPTTIIVVVVIALLVFGPHKMPELMRQLGQALREFKKMTGDVQNAFNLDEHLSYDRYDPPSYYNNYPSSTYEPLDQYQPEEDPHDIKALPAAEPEAAEAEAEAEAAEKPRRKRAPRKKKVETEVAEAVAPTETVHETTSVQAEEGKELEK